MSYFEPRCEVISENCDCDFLRVWGGPYESFWHGYTPTYFTGLPPMRLKEKLKGCKLQ